MVLLSAIFIISGCLALREIRIRQEEKENFDALAQRVCLEAPLIDDMQSTDTKNPDDAAVHKRDITSLVEENADCIGWVCVPGTTIDYPVMFTPDEPQRYLRRSFSGEYSICGVPFLDGRSKAEDENKTIFGHNMKDGSMFAGLHRYEDPAFYEEHPTIEYETADGCKEYTIFAVLKLYKEDPWYDFFSAADGDEYEKAVDEICRKALYDIGIRPSYPQELLTLSTCDGKDRNSRFVIVAARESAQY